MMYGQEGGYGSVPKKKNRGLVFGILIFLVVILAVGGIYLYRMFNSKNSIQFCLDAAFDYLEASIDDNDYDSITGEFSMNMNFQGIDDVEDYQIFDIFNKLELSGSYGVDYNSNIMNVELDADYKDKDLLDMDVYTQYGKAYIYLDDLYDKYISTNIDDYNSLFERDVDNLKNIVVGLRKGIEGSLKEEYYLEENVTIDSKKLTKTTLDLTGKNYLEFYNNFSQILLEDENFLESLAVLSDLNVDEIKESLNDSKEEVSDDDGLKIILYTDRIRFIKLEMIVSDVEGKIILEKDDDSYKYELYDMDEKILSGVVTVIENKDTRNVSFSYYFPDEGISFEISVDSFSKKNGKVKIEDVSNSISSEKITEDELMDIYNKLVENDAIVEIIDEVSALE